MRTLLLIEGDQPVNAVVVETSAATDPTIKALKKRYDAVVDITDRTDGAGLGIGWTWDGQDLVPPPEPEPEA